MASTRALASWSSGLSVLRRAASVMARALPIRAGHADALKEQVIRPVCLGTFFMWATRSACDHALGWHGGEVPKEVTGSTAGVVHVLQHMDSSKASRALSVPIVSTHVDLQILQ